MAYTLAGLGKCSCCGSSAFRVYKGGQSSGPRLVCSKAKIGAGCKYVSVPILSIETALASGVDMIVGEAPVGPEALVQEIERLDIEVDVLADEIDELVTALSHGFSQAIQKALAAKEAEVERVIATRERLSAELWANAPASVSTTG